MGFLKYQKALVGVKFVRRIHSLINYYNIELIKPAYCITELIKPAYCITELGPEGGEKGGKVVFEGLPEDMAKLKDNYTAEFLRGKL
jgi:hypothetical protein